MNPSADDSPPPCESAAPLSPPLTTSPPQNSFEQDENDVESTETLGERISSLELQIALVTERLDSLPAHRNNVSPAELQFLRQNVFFRDLVYKKDDNLHEMEKFAAGMEKDKSEQERKAKDDDSSEEHHLLPNDTFSFFVLGQPWRTSFFFACMVYVVQMFTFIFLLGLIGADRDQFSSNNPLQLPPNVRADVRACQVLALFITVLIEDNITTCITSWKNGFDKEALVQANFRVRSRFWWHLSVILRLVEGVAALAAIFILIMQTDNSRDVLLNFTAVQFVYFLDNSVFVLADLGFLGEEMARDAKKIMTAKLSKAGKNHTHMFYLPAMVCAILAFWLYLSSLQANGDFLCQTLLVQFDDSVADLSHFSGLYTQVKRRRWSEEVDYVEEPHIHIEGNSTQQRYSPSKIGYCQSENAWVFVHGSDPEDELSLCHDRRVRSSETESYDITTASSSQWYVKTADSREIPMDYFHLACYDCAGDEGFCGDHGICIDNRCQCLDGWYGLRCEFPVPCEAMRADPSDKNLPEKMEIVTGISVHNHPVYSGTALHVDEFGPLSIRLFMFYGGRRWEIVHPHPKRSSTESSNDQLLSVIQNDLFGRHLHSFWSVHKRMYVSAPSDYDTASDAATPHALRWFDARGLYWNEIETVYVCQGIFSDRDIQIAARAWLENKVSAQDLYGNIRDWDTSEVTDMTKLFSEVFQPGNARFNDDISRWDLSAVLTTAGMFIAATAFNQDVSSWDVSNVNDMSSMFEGAESFSQNLSQWDTTSVVNMQKVFSGATSFNGDVSGWRTAGVRTMSRLFDRATSFNQSIFHWETRGVTDMSAMFVEALAFNQDVSLWDTSSVNNMEALFYGAESFNQPLDKWNTFAVRTMDSMFTRAVSFNQDLSKWDTSKVTTMKGMFLDATSFNSDLTNWNVSSVTDMSNMFRDATSFNQVLCWHVSQDVRTDGMFCGSRGKFDSACVDERTAERSQFCLLE